jgi:hypothetical protein
VAFRLVADLFAVRVFAARFAADFLVVVREPLPDARDGVRRPPARSSRNWISVRAGMPVPPLGQ